MRIDKVQYFIEQCENAEEYPELIKEKLKTRDKYSGVTAAHACAKNGHAALLVKILQFFPEIAKMEDIASNLPLHSLCQNTSSDQESLLVMLYQLLEVHEDALDHPNLKGKLPLQILSERLNIEGDGFTNPYEKNLDHVRPMYAKMEMIF